jgi:hypothetical protein
MTSCAMFISPKYAVIQNAMDFQTMLKKVKQKHYKSKREFKDDLDLIWSNCLTYNADEVCKPTRWFRAATERQFIRTTHSVLA